MTLVDTSVWLDHLNSPVHALARLLQDDGVVTSLLVIGEIAMGQWKQRTVTLFELGRLPRCVASRNEEVLRLVDEHRLFGKGLSFIDVHLLASTLMTPDCRLWTRDKRLRTTAQYFGIASALV